MSTTAPKRNATRNMKEIFLKTARRSGEPEIEGFEKVVEDAAAGQRSVVEELLNRDLVTEEEFQTAADTAFETMRLSVDYRPGEALPTSRRTAFFRALDRTLRRALSNQFGDEHEFWFDTTRYPEYVDIRVAVDDGVLRFIAVREQVFSTTGHIFLIWIVGTSTLLKAFESAVSGLADSTTRSASLPASMVPLLLSSKVR